MVDTIISEQYLACAVLSVDQMYRADALTMEGWCSGIDLMENAGRGCASIISERWPTGHALILCGPGNNGGDGFVIARHLMEAGWNVRLALLGGHPEALKGDASVMASRWKGGVENLSADICLDGVDLVVDAVFGAGLSKPLGGELPCLFSRIKDMALPVAAVDMPSGVNGNDGTVDPATMAADLTITFFRPKIGHLLQPGRAACGDLEVVNIGIPPDVLHEINPRSFFNAPSLWADLYPFPGPDTHKYSRGHAIVLGGKKMTGAARMAAHAALRTGAGIVTCMVPKDVSQIYSISLPANVIVEPFVNASDICDVFKKPRCNAILVGPGAGLDAGLKSVVLEGLEQNKAIVLDADALSVFADEPSVLFRSLHENVVLTPHEGEFVRLFGQMPGSKVERACAAAQKTGCVVVLKGSDTVIAAPDGRAVINSNAPPWLATAGAGDVLAGFVLALLAQKMPPFEAACAAVWLHGECAAKHGLGLVATDLPDLLPRVLSEYFY